MSLLNMTVKHGRTIAEARTQLEQCVQQAQAQAGPLIQRVAWAPDRQAVHISATGVEVDMRVDAVEVHVVADAPLLGHLLGASPLVAGIKALVQRNFPKQLT